MWICAYIAVGLAAFLALRLAFKKARLDVRPHDKIWIWCLYSPEGWLFGVLFWPVLTIASVFWFAADLLHVQGKKEIKRAEELEAKRDKRFDGLDLMQKIELSKTEAEKRK